MDGFTIVDAIVGGIILISAILAFSRGLMREVMAIVGWIAAAVLAFTFAGTAEAYVREVPYLGDIIGDSCELGIITAFAIVFALALVVFSVFTPLFSSFLKQSALGTLDQGFGFIFGALRGALLVAVAFVVYDRVMSSDPIEAVENSRSAAVFASVQDSIEAQLPDDAPGWIVSQYEILVQACAPVQNTVTDTEL